MSDAATTDPGTGHRPSNRRELILEAAIDLFHERGYPATGVDDIGKAVDVAEPFLVGNPPASSIQAAVELQNFK